MGLSLPRACLPCPLQDRHHTMSYPQPDSYSGGAPQYQHQHQAPGGGMSSRGDGSGRGTSSGPMSSYATASTGDQSAGTASVSPAATYSSIHAPTSNMSTTPVSGGQGMSPFHMQGMPSSQGQPGSGGYTPTSSLIGAGGYISSSGQTVQHMYPSSNVPSIFSGSMASQPGQPGSMMHASTAAPYPAMAPVGSMPLPIHGPMSSVGAPMVGPHGLGPMDSATAHEAAKRMAGR